MVVCGPVWSLLWAFWWGCRRRAPHDWHYPSPRPIDDARFFFLFPFFLPFCFLIDLSMVFCSSCIGRRLCRELSLGLVLSFQLLMGYCTGIQRLQDLRKATVINFIAGYLVNGLIIVYSPIIPVFRLQKDGFGVSSSKTCAVPSF